MMSAERDALTISEAARLIRERAVSPVELVAACLERIRRNDAKLHAFITVLEESALEQARNAEQAVARGDALGPLHGVPLALKDCFAIRGVRMTGGSKLLAHNIPNQDSTVVERLRSAGAVIVGTLNMHEFALGATTANPHYGVARNPWSQDHIPGGSSGGSGIAVAAGLVFVPCKDGLAALRIDASKPSFTLAWEAAPYANSAVFAYGLVWTVASDAGTYRGNWKGTLYGLDPATGAVRAQLPLGPIPHYPSPAAAGGSLYVAGLGVVYAVSVA